MPRIEAERTERSPEKGAPASRLTPGDRLPMARTSTRLRLCRVSAVNAEIAIGTSWMFAERRCAVTITSARTLELSAWAVDAGACCACAAPEVNTARAPRAHPPTTADRQAEFVDVGRLLSERFIISIPP